MSFTEDETEVMDGTRTWATTQELFRGVSPVGTPRYDLDVGWYDSNVEPNAGAFCLVQAGGQYEDLVGERVAVVYGDKTIYLYCLGSTNLDQDVALARAAFFRMADLAEDTIPVSLQVIQ